MHHWLYNNLSMKFNLRMSNKMTKIRSQLMTEYKLFIRNKVISKIKRLPNLNQVKKDKVLKNK